MKSKTVVILVTPGIQVLDASGARDVFAEANVQAGSDVYQVHVLAARREQSVVHLAYR